MEISHYIKLACKEKLTREQLEPYFKKVKKISDAISMNPDSKPITLTKEDGYYIYCIYLIRNLEINEIQEIKIYCTKELKEVSGIKLIVSAYSIPVERYASHTDNVYDTVENIATVPSYWPLLSEEVAKYQHNKWMESKIHNGWHWGISFDMDAKTHPLLVEWNRLPELYKTVDPRFGEYFVTLLNNLKLQIVSK